MENILEWQYAVILVAMNRIAGLLCEAQTRVRHLEELSNLKTFFPTPTQC